MSMMQGVIMAARVGARDAGRKRKGPSWVDVLLAATFGLVLVWLGFRAAGAV